MQIMQPILNRTGKSLALLCGVSLALTTTSLFAQLGSTAGGAASRELSQIRNQSVGNAFTTAQINRQTLVNSRANVPWSTGLNQSLFVSQSFDSGGLSSKPFGNITQSPTVSPYLGLFNNSLSDSVLPNYNQFVQPRLQQQQFMRNQSRQTQEMNFRVQQISAQSAYEVNGSEFQIPTGHQVGFMYYSHFYPSNNRRR